MPLIARFEEEQFVPEQTTCINLKTTPGETVKGSAAVDGQVPV